MRSTNRDIEYCGSSMCFSSCIGRMAPCWWRSSSSSASYHASAGNPAFFRSRSTAPSRLCCTRTSRAQAVTAPAEGLRAADFPAFDMIYPLADSCSCIKLDKLMQLHLHRCRCMNRLLRPCAGAPHQIERICHEALLCSRRLFAVAAHRAAREWLNFTASELHKGFSPLFNSKTPEDYRTIVNENLSNKFAYLDKVLAGRDYLMGKTFTVADAYLFTILNWRHPLKIDISAYKNLQAYADRVGARPKVKEAMQAEGLLKAA